MRLQDYENFCVQLRRFLFVFIIIGGIFLFNFPSKFSSMRTKAKLMSRKSRAQVKRYQSCVCTGSNQEKRERNGVTLGYIMKKDIRAWCSIAPRLLANCLFAFSSEKTGLPPHRLQIAFGQHTHDHAQLVCRL